MFRYFHSLSSKTVICLLFFLGSFTCFTFKNLLYAQTIKSKSTIPSQIEVTDNILNTNNISKNETNISGIEKLMAGEIPSIVSTALEQFGYNLFRQEISTFAPVTDVPVGDDYIIGPGDIFTITLWGKAEVKFQAEVSRSGEINLPTVGVLKVWGLTLSQLKKTLQKELSKYYPEFEINITMNELRVIQVFAVGEVNSPGSYSVSSLSTMINALFACGGPTKNGSLRNIQLSRNGKVVNTFDLYEFLLHGDKSQDVRLQPGDTIFVPVIGKVVGIAGSVKRPAIYEMKDAMTIGELMELAGGVTPSSYLQRVQIERLADHEKKIKDLDISKDTGEKDNALRTPLRDGDMVKIYSIVPATKELGLPLTKNIVYLEGHVVNPNGYELKPGMKISDIITSFKDLQPQPHLDYAELVRMEEPDFHEVRIPFNLGKILQKNPQSDLKLQPFDRIIIYSKLDFKDDYKVTVEGEVRRPGEFLLYEGMRIKNLIENAGGVKDLAYMKKAELTRLKISNDGVKTDRIEIDLDKAMQEDETQNLILHKHDILKIRIVPEWLDSKTITIKGKVKFPGKYTMKKGETLSSVLQRAGGFTDDAYLRGAVFTRVSVMEKQRERLNDLIDKQSQEIQAASAIIMQGSMEKEDASAAQQSLTVQQNLLEKLRGAKVTGRVVVKLCPLEQFIGSEYDIPLEDKDELNVPEKPSTIDVLGEVFNPTTILYRNEKTVGYYMNRVGGPTQNAEGDQIYLISADGSVISRSQKTGWTVTWSDDNKLVSDEFMTTKLEPGDTILVPRKLEKIQWLKTTSQLTQILYQSAIAAGVAIALF